MSTSCKIILRNVEWIKREIILYQPLDGHPNNMILSLMDELNDIYSEYSEYGDSDWFLDPSKVAGSLVVRSVPVINEDMRKLMSSLPSSSRSRLESTTFLNMPTIFPDNYRMKSVYEYVITLRETFDKDDKLEFFGYTVEVYKLLQGRRISTLLQEDRNLIKRIPFVNDTI